jgi:hypothetical protein
MASRTLPGLGLKGFWGSGFDGWDAEMDANLLLLSTLVQGIAKSYTTTLPGSPVNGDIYIVKVGDANANKIAVRDNGAWTYFTAITGWRLWVTDAGKFYVFNGTTWDAEETKLKAPSYTVAGVPSASTKGAGAMIYVSNETGGAVLAFSDGTAWRRVTDRAVIA